MIKDISDKVEKEAYERGRADLLMPYDVESI